MLRRLTDLPGGIVGVEAHGTVTGEDYENVLNPILADLYEQGTRVRFLYRFENDFSGFTAGAAWDDLKLGLRYLRLFERCAIVSDVEWIRKSSDFFGSFLPCPVRSFQNEEAKQAIEWLGVSPRESNLRVDFMADKGVLVVEPKGPLAAEDFDSLATIVDPWIEDHKYLQGLVINVKSFPGWEDIGSFLRHIQFVRGHHKKIERVAIAADGLAADFLPMVGAQFVQANVKSFPYKDLSKAVEWAQSGS